MRHFSRRTPSTPVTIGLVAALVLSLCIGMTAALPVAQGRSPIRSLPLTANSPDSNTLVGCVGTTASGTNVTLGGRVIYPATILRVDSSGTCGSNETALSWNRYLSTVLVSPIPGGTPQANGQALQAAMNFITSAQPGPNKPYLLKVEPGNYDLGTTPLTLLPFVDLEGSGRGVTIISSVIASTNPPTSATLIGADNSQARYIQIVNNNLNGGGDTSPAILIPSTVVSGFSLDHVTAKTTHGGNTAAGDTIFNSGIVSVQNSDLYSSGALNPRAFVNSIVATATIQSSNLYASSGGSRVRGFYNLGNLTVKDSSINASNNTNKFTYGINSDSTTAVLKVYNTSINITGTTGGVAIQVPNGQAIIQNSTVNSVVVGFSGCANTNSCNIKMAYTQFNAPGVGGNSGLTCLGVYDINLQPVTC